MELLLTWATIVGAALQLGDYVNRMYGPSTISAAEIRSRRILAKKKILAAEVSKESPRMKRTMRFFSDFGKESKEILHNYNFDQSCNCTLPGLVMTIGSEKRDVSVNWTALLKKKYVTVGTDANMFLPSVNVEELAPGLKAILRFVVSDHYQRSGKVELQYQHEYASMTTSLGLSNSLVMNFSGVLGNDALSIGTDMSFDTCSSTLTKLNVGLGLYHANSTAFLILTEKGDKLSASYYQSVGVSTAFGAELSRSFSSNKSTCTAGVQHSLGPLTSVKVSVNNYRMASALKHEWRPNSQFYSITGTISEVIDFRDFWQSRIALALTFKPLALRQ